MVRKISKQPTAKKRIDEGLAITYLVTLVFGLIMVYSTSSVIAESRFGSHMFFLRQQMLWALMSIIAIAVILRIDIKKYAVYSVPALLVTMILLSMVFLMPARNGSHRWIMMGPMTFQPSEMFRLVVVAFLAFSLSNPKRDITKLKQLLFPYLPIIGLGLLLILAEPDLGTTMVIFLTCLGLFFLAGARIKHLASGLLPLAAGASAVVFLLGYKKARVMHYLTSVTDPLQGGYQVKQAVLTLGSGGVLGIGLGDGRQKAFFLPYPHTDFIFASVGEEVGLVGLLLLLMAFFYMIWRGFRIASRQPDRFGYLLASGMTISLFLNIAINIAVVTALLPVTGLPLPFISYGGSSLLMSSIAVGILLNLSRRKVRAR